MNLTLNSIFHTGTFSLEKVLIAFGTALVLGMVIALLYKACIHHSGKFVVMLAVLPMLVTSIIMIVNGNLGVSVAVLGAFGLVRFRSIPGTAWDIGFLFYAMAVGLAVGLGFLSLGVLITVIVGGILFLLEKIGFGNTRSKMRHLMITIPEDLNYTGAFEDLFQKYTKHTELEYVKTTNLGSMFELSYTVELKDSKQEKDFIDDIRCRNGNLTIMMGLVQSDKNVL